MKARRNDWRFKLVEIHPFDARRGYTRCVPPGVGCAGTSADSDFWRDRTGKLVVRCSRQGEAYHFEALLASGEDVPEEAMWEFGEYIGELLFEWVANWSPADFDELVLEENMRLEATLNPNKNAHMKPTIIRKKVDGQGRAGDGELQG